MHTFHLGRFQSAGAEFGATGPLGSDRLLYRLDTAFMRTNGFRGAGYNRFDIAPKLFWRITPKDQFRVNISYNRDYFDGDVGIPLMPFVDNGGDVTGYTFPTGINLSNRYNTPGNFEHLNYPLIQLFYEHQFNDKWKFRQAAGEQYVGDEYWQSEGVFVGPGSSPPMVLRGADDFAVYFDHLSHFIQSQSDVTGEFDWGRIRHQVLFGYEFDELLHRTKRSAQAQDTVVPPIDLFNPVETAPAVTDFPASRFDGFHNQEHAIYFQDYISVHPRLQFVVGGRFETYHHFDFRNPVVDGVEMPSPHTNVFAEHPFTYRVGVISQILPFLSLYSSWSTAFTAQTALSSDGTPLKPESGRQYEVGSRTTLFGDRVSFNVAFFHIDRNNVNIFRPDETVIQAGQQYSLGAEAEFRARINGRLNLYATYGYTKTAFNQFTTFGFFPNDPEIVDLRGNVPGLIPAHTSSAWMNYELPRGFSFSVGEHSVSKRATDFYDFFYMPAFATMDAALRYRHDRVEYSLNISNLLNKRNYLISAIDDTQVYPGPPIDAQLTVRYHF